MGERAALGTARGAGGVDQGAQVVVADGGDAGVHLALGDLPAETGQLGDRTVIHHEHVGGIGELFGDGVVHLALVL